MTDESTTADPTEGGKKDPAAEAAAEQDKERKASGKKSSKSERRLVAYVHVTNPVDGSRNVFGPDDEVPDWAQDVITNEKAWEGGLPHAIDENAPTPGANQFAQGGPKTTLSKTKLYELDKEELVRLNQEAGIEASMSDTKRDLVENLHAR